MIQRQKFFTLFLTSIISSTLACSGGAQKAAQLDEARSTLAGVNSTQKNCNESALKHAETLMAQAEKFARVGEIAAANRKATEAIEWTNDQVLKPCPAQDKNNLQANNSEPASNQLLCKEASKRLGLPIFFEFDEAGISPEAGKTLQAYQKFMQQCPDLNLTLAGHTDNRGSEEYNITLGESRAQTVQKYLKNLGITPKQIRTVSYGEAMPAVNKINEAAHAKNRRVEVISAD
jgi:peptidoglycan-associated lipoprotein